MMLPVMEDRDGSQASPAKNIECLAGTSCFCTLHCNAPPCQTSTLAALTECNTAIRVLWQTILHTVACDELQGWTTGIVNDSASLACFDSVYSTGWPNCLYALVPHRVLQSSGRSGRGVYTRSSQSAQADILISRIRTAGMYMASLQSRTSGPPWQQMHQTCNGISP